MSGYQSTSQALLEKYDQPGPRYTSYPTAPVWTEDFGQEDWREAFAEANAHKDSPFSLYVHIPYCDSLCYYCGCSVIITKSQSKGDAYVDRLLQEAALLANALPDRRSVQQHHWGGGTPTFLQPAQLERLYMGLQEFFPSANTAEVSIEVDPRVTSEEQLETLRRIGFNRISMGVQDFDPQVQECIHRVQSKELTRRIIDKSRDLGFQSINVDLVYGLPKQTLQGFGDTLDTIIDWGADRVACYSFAYVPWLKKHMKVLPEKEIPDRSAKFALFRLALEKFGAASYESIGLDHFASPGDPLSAAAREGRMHRNFMGYTTRMGDGRDPEDMLNLGITSIGEVAGRFAQNVKDVRAWEAAIEAGRYPIERGWKRSKDDEERRRIILDLMCRFRLDYADYGFKDGQGFEERYAKNLEPLRAMEEDGLLRFDDEGLSVLDKGRIFLRNIAMPFDAYLEKQRSSDKPMFSRTV
jgi:oxygen-independent coproporphyrinogen III oxidase